MSKLEEYQTKKVALTSELEQVNRDCILTEQSVKQQEELFMQQFQTTDISELQKIATQYQDAIVAKEAELAALEQA